MPSSTPDDSKEPLNWTAIAAVYVALAFGFGGTLYWGEYRNAAWLALLGIAGGLTAYGRVLENRGAEREARRWKWVSGLVYGIFFLWAGAVLLRTLLGR